MRSEVPSSDHCSYIPRVIKIIRSRLIRAVAAFFVLAASGGAEPAHGSAHFAETEARGEHLVDGLQFEAAHDSGGDHGHETVARGIVVRSTSWDFIPSGPDAQIYALVSAGEESVISMLEPRYGSVNTGPPPRLRAPPAA